jgi:hypothetical protein
MLMQTKTISQKEIITFTIISLIVVLILDDSSLHFLFIPLKLYRTAIHEGWHGIITLVSGGSIINMKLNLNGSGSLTHIGGIDVLISPAGYIGCALTGSLLVISSRREIAAKFLLLIISFIVMILGVLYIDNFLSIAFISSIIVSIGIVYITIKTDFSNHVAIFLGTILAVGSFEDIKTIVLYIPHETDAGILAQSFGLDFLALPIAFIFAMICMSIWWLSIKYIMKNR